MSAFPEGDAIVYCEGAFGTLNGKTAHGLVRRSRRYRVRCVVDSRHAGEDAGQVLDRSGVGIPIHENLGEAISRCAREGARATHLVIGLAPDGGRLPSGARADVIEAIRKGLDVDSGLHDFLSEDPELSRLAEDHGVVLRDTRKPPPRSALHFFSGKIGEVHALRIAVLGTDSAVGKRTTAWKFVEALECQGYSAEMIGTGQTAWMQGARFGIVLDALVNDFVAGEIEHAIWSAWKEIRPHVMVLEGQGSLMNPAYPGGFELLAAGRPHGVVLQHAPTRKDYDGFPGFPIHPLAQQIQAVELIGGRPVVAIAVNHEGLDAVGAREACRRIEEETGLPSVDVLLHGAERLVDVLASRWDLRKMNA